MSLTIMLVPAIIAAIAAASGTGVAGAVGAGLMANGKGPGTMQVATRMKDRVLLDAALADCGATGIQSTENSVKAEVDGSTLEMTKNPDGIWEAHFTQDGSRPIDEVAARELITRLDAAYAGRVQSAVAEKIRLRADDAGLELVSETVEDDATVTMVLNVRQGG